MNNSGVLKYCQFVCNKEQVGNSLSPVEFTQLLQVCNLKHFKKKIGLPEEYKVGMPLARQTYDLTQKLTEDLKQFKVWMGSPDISQLQIDGNGIASLPSDYYYPSSLSFKHAINSCSEMIIKTRMIEVVTDAQWDDVVSHPIKQPTYKYPVCNFQNTFIRFLPNNLRFVDFIYLRQPKTPVYDYYFGTDGSYIYLPQGINYTLQAGEQGSNGQTSGVVVSQTQELEWDDINKLDIAALILQHIGINLREGALMQYSEKVLNTGT